MTVHHAGKLKNYWTRRMLEFLAIAGGALLIFFVGAVVARIVQRSHHYQPKVAEDNKEDF